MKILAFPCNNFGSQEPGTNEQIKAFAANKGATFSIMGKLECENGEMTHPLYKFLRSSITSYIFGKGLKWNFAKFLCDAEGKPVSRYSPITAPLSIEKDILKLIEK